jgi:hypothetical protein
MPLCFISSVSLPRKFKDVLIILFAEHLRKNHGFMKFFDNDSADARCTLTWATQRRPPPRPLFLVLLPRRRMYCVFLFFCKTFIFFNILLSLILLS